MDALMISSFDWIFLIAFGSEFLSGLFCAVYFTKSFANQLDRNTWECWGYFQEEEVAWQSLDGHDQQGIQIDSIGRFPFFDDLLHIWILSCDLMECHIARIPNSNVFEIRIHSSAKKTL
jgi:hypothetical protein